MASIAFLFGGLRCLSIVTSAGATFGRIPGLVPDRKPAAGKAVGKPEKSWPKAAGPNVIPAIFAAGIPT